MGKEQLTDIPEDQVPDIVRNYVLSGAIKIAADRQDDGKWTITSEMP